MPNTTMTKKLLDCIDQYLQLKTTSLPVTPQQITEALDAIKLCLHLGADPNPWADSKSHAFYSYPEHRPPLYLYLLHRAVEANDRLLLNTLLTSGANQNCHHEVYNTPIEYAAKQNKWELVNILLDHATPNADTLGRVLFQLIASNEHKNDLTTFDYQLVYKLIDRKPNLTIWVECKNFESCLNGQFSASFIKRLLDAGLVLNLNDTPFLCKAIEKKNWAAVEVVLNHTVLPPNIIKTAFGHLCNVPGDNAIEIMKRLISAGGDPNDLLRMLLGGCSYPDAAKKLEFALQEKSQPFQASDSSPHILAVKNKRWELLEVIVNHLKQTNSALAHAKQLGVILIEALINDSPAARKLIPVLIEAGAAVNDDHVLFDQFRSYTPLHAAVEKKNQEAIYLLLVAGADFNRKNVYGRTVSEEAKQVPEKEIALTKAVAQMRELHRMHLCFLLISGAWKNKSADNHSPFRLLPTEYMMRVFQYAFSLTDRAALIEFQNGLNRLSELETQRIVMRDNEEKLTILYQRNFIAAYKEAYSQLRFHEFGWGLFRSNYPNEIAGLSREEYLQRLKEHVQANPQSRSAQAYHSALRKVAYLLTDSAEHKSAKVQNKP